MNQTIVSNSFTGYNKTIRHKEGFPAVSTLRKHLRAAKAKDCRSETQILLSEENGRTLQLDIVDNRVEIIG